MYFVNKDLSIYATRGDAVVLAVGANNNGVPYVFQPGEVVRFRVFEKKGCHCTVLQKDFIITDAVESVDIVLTKNETEIGEIISKPKDYWYEIELNPNYNPQTIVGYDDDGPKVFRLFPEGADVGGGEGEAPDEYVPAIGGYLPYVTEEDNGKTMRVVDGAWVLAEGVEKITVDDALDINSTNPVQNCVVAREISAVTTTANTAQATANAAVQLATDVVDAVKPFRFTVTQDGARYTASKTYEEIAAVLNTGNRLVICEFNGYELPFAGYIGDHQMFYTAAYGHGVRIYISYHGLINVEREERPPEIVYVSDHGAEGDGETDDTEAIQAALDCGGTIIFDRKTYMVDAVTRLQVRSNSHIILPVGCTLQAMPTDSGNYTVLNMTEDVENVCISGGGKVAGDMSEDGKDPATQAGHGIRVRGSKNVTIDGIEVCDCWGDCIAIHGAYDNSGKYPNGNDDLAKNVVVRDCVLHDARRSAISIQGCNGFKSVNNEIYGVYGTIPECGMDFEGKPEYPNTDCEVWNTHIHDVGVTGGITVDSGNASISFYGCELDSLRLNADIGKLNLKGCTIGLLRLVAITQLDKVLVHNCTIGRAEVNIESPDVEFHKCDFVPMGDEEMCIRFLSTGKATDEKRLNHATFEGCYFRTRPNNASDKKNALLMFSKEPLDTISLTNCVFEVYNQIGITIVATNGITFTHNTVKQVHAKSGGEYQYIMNFQTTQGTDSTIVFANNTVDLKGVKNYHYKSAEAMRLYAATVFMLNNLIESAYTVTSTDSATGKKYGLSAVLCKMAGAYNTKKAVVANNTVDGLFATHFTYPTTEGFVVKESNNLLLCEE